MLKFNEAPEKESRAAKPGRKKKEKSGDIFSDGEGENDDKNSTAKKRRRCVCMSRLVLVLCCVYYAGRVSCRGAIGEPCLLHTLTLTLTHCLPCTNIPHCVLITLCRSRKKADDGGKRKRRRKNDTEEDAEPKQK